jgi:hypothetical protein
MPRRIFSRFVLPALLGFLVGFFALACAVPNESSLPVPLVSVFSPGLKVAELVMPASHQSLAGTFSWFLRIAIGVNGLCYSMIFIVFAHLVGRTRPAKR